ncbi:TPA: peptidase domain-containing ABC transporter [Vibrio vulnificus]
MRKKINLVLQDEISECGLACISMVCGYYGIQTSLYSLRRQYSVGLEGLSFFDLESILFNNGISSCSYQLEIDELEELSLPAILQWRNRHFVVLSKVTEKYIEIYDPAFGKKIYSKDTIKNVFSGYAIETNPPVSLNKTFDKNEKRASLKSLAFSIQNVKKYSVYFFLSLSISQLFTLLTPKLLSLVIDEVIGKNDLELFYFIAIFFLILYFMDFVNKIIGHKYRELISKCVDKDLSSKCVNTIVNQTPIYIQKRSIQDIIQRLSLSLHYGEYLVDNYIKLLCHFVFSIVFLSAIFFINTMVGLIVSLACSILLMLRFCFINRISMIRSNILEQQINQNIVVSEYYYGINGHKLNQVESQYQDKINKLSSLQIKMNLYLDRILNSGDYLYGFVNNVTTLALCYFFVSEILENSLNIGSLFILFFYKEYLLMNFSRCIEIIININKTKPDWYMVESLIHDFSLEKNTGNVISEQEVKSITLRNVALSYSSFAQPILSNVNVDIEKNDFVGIIGRSGAGKSSLIKIIMSLIEPSEGQVIINNYDIKKFGIFNYREQVSAYLADDSIYNGTVVYNITTNEENVDYNRIKYVLEKTYLIDEVNELVNGVETLLGDGGVILSSGQKQRLCIARMLYKEPKIALFDEPTANLDDDLKSKLLKSIQNLNATRILVTHDRNLLQCCNKVYEVTDGKVKRIK